MTKPSLSYIRKEAILSSQIEGTQSSLSDLLLFEHHVAPGVPIEDVRETSNYIQAMTHGLQRMKDGFPLSLRLIKESHALLIEGGRGGERAPGELRRTQNWIGGTRPGNARYVPPPAHEVMPAMGALEKFLHNDPVRTPVLVKAALAHAQFETIHPFLDGNGRVSRLLVTLDIAVSDVVFTIPEASRRLGLSGVSVGKAARHLEDLGIAREVTGRTRNKIYLYSKYLELLQEGTEDEPG